MLCKLCLTESDLCQSHIIPEFFYRPTYDDKHRAYELSSDPPGERFLQKGYREPLLCQECEARLAKYESYVAGKWYGERVVPSVLQADPLVIENLDYMKFKLFHLAVLWRAGAATGEMFLNVQLGSDAEAIRKMILCEHPGAETDYGLFGYVLVDDDDKRIIHEFVMQPLQSEIEGHRVASFIFGGCLWHYTLAGYSAAVFKSCLFTEAGRLTLPKKRFLDLPFIRNFARTFSEERRPENSENVAG